MNKIFSIHILPFILCFWYIGYYILQPFPSNIIAVAVIGIVTYNSFRIPANGAITAVFLTPLTLSLGRHLEAYLKESAPPYLPYAEIIMVSTLWGWVFRAILNRFNPERFPIVQKGRTDIEKITFCVMGLWVTLAVLGVYPALYRNLMTSPSIPWDLFAVKIAFAPVWGLADEFFPITVALRTLLGFAFFNYAQKLISGERIYQRVAFAFILSMSLVAAYALVQVLVNVGYSKSGRPETYVQSTFHENESFASFCLMALGIGFPLFFSTSRLIHKLFIFIGCAFCLIGVALSGSRAVMLLGLTLMGSCFVWSLIKELEWIRNYWKEAASFVLLLPALWLGLTFISPGTVRKIERLVTDYEVLNANRQSEELFSGKVSKSTAGIQGGSLTIVARIRLWYSSLKMFADSWGAGMGTGAFFRLTGFPRYQAMNMMENAHFYWLQMLAEFGWMSVFLMSLFFTIPLWIIYDSEFLYQKILAGGILILGACNIVGQSLLQNELLWCSLFVVGFVLRGNVPHWLKSARTWKIVYPRYVPVLEVLLTIQLIVWALPVQSVERLGFPQTRSDTYGYHFDMNGHRYLQVGDLMKEEIYAPGEGCVIEFRLHPGTQRVSVDNPIQIKAVLTDSLNRIIASNSVKVQSQNEIVSLFVPLETQESQILTLLLRTNRIAWQGSLMKSDERKKVGFRYYGYYMKSVK